MLHIWCRMDVALSPQLLPLISNTEQVVTLSPSCHRVTYPSIGGRFFQSNFTFNMCFKLHVLVMFMFVPAILGRTDHIETPQKSIEISISFLLVLSCEVITSIWMLQWIQKYFSMFKMDPFHLIISAISNPHRSLCCYPHKPEWIWSLL